jgi:hypothetical protein
MCTLWLTLLSSHHPGLPHFTLHGHSGTWACVACILWPSDIWLLCSYCLADIWLLSGWCLADIVWLILSGWCLATVWLISGYCLADVWLILSGWYCLADVWLLSGWYLADVWPLWPIKTFWVQLGSEVQACIAVVYDCCRLSWIFIFEGSSVETHVLLLDLACTISSGMRPSINSYIKGWCSGKLSVTVPLIKAWWYSYVWDTSTYWLLGGCKFGQCAHVNLL